MQAEHTMGRTPRIFRYLPALDAFIVTDEYRALAECLGLAEWHPVVWIGRLFTLDNDYGEHWFDNWDERQEKAQAADALGIDPEELLIIHPERFTDDRDGPCHPPEMRKRFWTDVLTSLELSYPLLFEEARRKNHKVKDILPEAYIEDVGGADCGTPGHGRPPQPRTLDMKAPEDQTIPASVHLFLPADRNGGASP